MLPRNGDAFAGRRRRGTLKPPRHPAHPDRSPAWHALSMPVGGRPPSLRLPVYARRGPASLQPAFRTRTRQRGWTPSCRWTPLHVGDLLAPRDALWSFSGQRRATVLAGASTRLGGPVSGFDAGRRRARRVLRRVVGRGLPPVEEVPYGARGCQAGKMLSPGARSASSRAPWMPMPAWDR
jgi:hypothetical protein